MNWLKLAKEVIVAFVIAGVVLLLIGLMSDESSPPPSTSVPGSGPDHLGGHLV